MRGFVPLMFSFAFFCSLFSVNALAIDVGSCGNLSTAGAVYDLVGSAFNASGNCLDVEASNIVINGNGRLLNFSYGPHGGIGVNVSGYTNVTVGNMTLLQGNYSLQGNTTAGIFMGWADYSTVRNVTVTITNSTGVLTDINFQTGNGIWLLEADNSTVSNANITTAGSFWVGIYVLNSTNVSVVRNNVTSNDSDTSYGRAILVVNSSLANVTANRLDVEGPVAYGIDFYRTGNSTMFLNNVTVHGGDASCLILFNSSNDTLLNNSLIVLGSNGDGVHDTDASYNLVANNTIFVNASFAMGIYEGYSSHNTLAFNRITSVDYYAPGILFDGSNYTTAKNNTITSTGNMTFGIYLAFSMGLNITGNTMNTTGGFPIYFQEGSDESYFNHSVTQNIDRGGPLYYYALNSSLVIANLSGVGQLILANVTNAVVRNVSTSVHGILSIRSVNVSIYDSNISAYGTFGIGAVIFPSSNWTSVRNTNMTTYGTYGYGILVGSGNNLFEGNNITARGTESGGIYALLAGSSTIANNNLTAYGNNSYGVILDSTLYNNVTANRLAVSSGTDFMLASADGTNVFSDMNFTAAMSIYIYDAYSVFNYSNNASEGVWLSTSFDNRTINRTISVWNRTLLKWNDTNVSDTLSATYSLVGLSASSIYGVYNASGGAQGSASTTTGSSGAAESFTLALFDNIGIVVNYSGPIPSSPPSGGGGGGGGAAIASAKAVFLNSEFAAGGTYADNFSTGDSAIYQLKNVNYSAVVLGTSDLSVLFSVSPGDYNFSLSVGGARNLDLDGDGVDDLSLGLTASSSSTAAFVFAELKAAAPPSASPGESAAAEQAEVPEAEPSDYGTVAAVVVAAAAAAVLFFFRSKWLPRLPLKKKARGSW